MAGGLQGQSCISALREIETWLAEADKRRQHTLHDTSKNFIEHFLMSNTGNNAQIEQPSTSTGIHEQAYRTGVDLPSSLHSLAKVTIHCLGWTDLPAGLPILSEDEELKFLSGQLDTSPCTYRSACSAADSETDSDIVIALARSSHSSRLAGPLADAYLKVVDVSVPGFRISESSVEQMVEDPTSAIADLDDSRTVVLIQSFDNSIFYSCKAHGEKILTRKGKDGKFSC
jgi:hypothetical protein